MKVILRFFSALIFVVLYFYLSVLSYRLLQVFLPMVIVGTWKSYILWGLAGAGVEGIFVGIFFLLSLVAARFYRPLPVRIICILMSITAFVLSAVWLWDYVTALYYAGFWEYFWGVVLTVYIFAYFAYSVGFLLFTHNKDDI